MYSAYDIVGLSMYARQRVPIMQQPWDDAEISRYIEPGRLVGTVTTYLEPRAGRSHLYWVFEDVFGASYYAPHIPGMYDLEMLRLQGLLTIEEKDIVKDHPEWYNLASDVIGSAKSLIWIGLAGFMAVKILPRLFK